VKTKCLPFEAGVLATSTFCAASIARKINRELEFLTELALRPN
jgi:hypothetical protein